MNIIRIIKYEGTFIRCPSNNLSTSETLGIVCLITQPLYNQTPKILLEKRNTWDPVFSKKEKASQFPVLRVNFDSQKLSLKISRNKRQNRKCNIRVRRIRSKCTAWNTLLQTLSCTENIRLGGREFWGCCCGRKDKTSKKILYCWKPHGQLHEAPTRRHIRKQL